MPQIFRIGAYWVYFWSNENRPLEPVLFMCPKEIHPVTRRKFG